MWYSTTCIFYSEIGGETGGRPLCEERVVLFDANDEEQALKAAKRYGRLEAHSYANAKGETVRWRFAAIESVHVLEGPSANGWEVSAKFVRRSLSTLRKLAKSP